MSRVNSIKLAAAIFLYYSLGALLVPTPLHAWPPLYGPEFTFTNGRLAARSQAKNSDSLEALRQWRWALEKLCGADGGCTILSSEDKHGPTYRVQYADGFWYEVGIDNAVLEVKSQPNSRASFQEKKSRLQSHIFDLAHSLGLSPHPRLGGGHINIGLESTFENDPLLFRNFLVDQANHPELYLGILELDPANAPTLSQQSKKVQEAFHRVIHEFDYFPGSIDELARRIESEVYTEHALGWSPKYYQNLRLEFVSQLIPPEVRRVEVRGVRAQGSMDEFLLQLELFEKRLDFLRKFKHPIPIQLPLSAERIGTAELKARFAAFLREMGEPPEKYDSLMPPNLSVLKSESRLIPYPEMHQNFQARDRYGRAWELMKAVSPEQTRELDDRVLASGEKKGALYHLPWILTPSEKDLLTRATEQRARALRALLEDLGTGANRILQEGTLPPGVIEKLLESNGSNLEKIRRLPWKRSGAYLDSTFVRLSNGEWALAANDDPLPGANPELLESRKELLKRLPKYQEVLKDGQMDSFEKTLSKSLQQLLKNPRDARVLLVPPAVVESWGDWVSQHQAQGVHVVGTHQKERLRIDSQSGDLYLDAVARASGSQKETLRVGAVGNWGLDRIPLRSHFPQVVSAFENGKISFFGLPGEGLEFLSDKSLFRLEDAFIRFYLKEEPLVPRASPIEFQVSASKSARYQKRVPMSVLGQESVALQVHATLTQNQIGISEHFTASTRPIEGEPRIVAVFVEGRDSVPPGSVSIPDDPRQLNQRRAPEPARCQSWFQRFFGLGEPRR